MVVLLWVSLKPLDLESQSKGAIYLSYRQALFEQGFIATERLGRTDPT